MENPPGPRRFTTTRWSLVGQARLDQGSVARARTALDELCRLYWYPLYAFVRNRGHSATDAQDLTQGFFAKLLETDGLASAEQGRGRFRSYLLGAMKHFLANEWHRAQTQKRGGEFRFIEWDPFELEARYSRSTLRPASPEVLFDREWALEIVSRALKTLRDEMSRSGKAEQFEALKGSLTGRAEHSRSEIAALLGMNEGAVKVSIHRLRGRYRVLLREAIAETVDNQADLEDEMRYLASVLRNW